MNTKQVKDYIKAVRRRNRQEEINKHSKPISLRPAHIKKSKKEYKRKKKVDIDSEN